MIECMIHTVKTDMVIHTAKTEMMKFVVEIECVGRDADEFDKETGSSDGLQPKQADLSCVHALNEPHLLEIHVVSRSDEMIKYIVGILKPSNKAPMKEVTKGLVIDAELLDRVLKVPITTVKCVCKEIPKYLSDFKLEVGVSGGVEAMLHSVKRLLSEYHNDGSLSMLIVHFLNAFNLMDRSALLYKVRIKDSCKLDLHAWYLDDGTIIEDLEEVTKVLQIIKVSGLILGLELNIKKTKIFWPSDNGTKLREGLFLIDIQRTSSGEASWRSCDVGLICWFERTESVFSRSNYIEDCKVKFATGTLTKEALSWWNSFAQPIGIEEAYKLSWVEFKKLLIKSTVFELSFDVIVGMDWLSKYHAKIICDKKVVYIPINGETLIIRVQITKDEAGNEVEVPPITAQQILARTRKRKAKSTLLMAIPDEHLARFHGIKDAKTLWAAIKTQFGGNAESKKADIKGSFRSSSNSQNVAFVSAESTSITNELNAAYSVFSATGHSSQEQGSSSYADELVFLFFANQSSSPQLNNEDLEKIDQDDLEEMDLKWQVVMLSMRVKRFYKKTGKRLEFNRKEQVGFDKTKVECFNCHRRGHFARDYRSARNSGNKSRDARNVVYKGRNNGTRHTKEEDKNTLIVQDGLSTYECSYQVDEEATDFALMAFTSNPSSSSCSNSKFKKKEVLVVKEEEVTETVFDNRSSDAKNSLANDWFKKGERYHAVPLPLTKNYMHLSFAGLDDSIYTFKISEIVTSVTKYEKDAPKTSTACVDKPKEDRSSALLIQDWDTDKVKLRAKSSDDKATDDKPKSDIGSKTVEELVNKEDQAYRVELDRLMSQEKEASNAVDALRKESEQGCMDQRGATNAGSTNPVNTVSAEADFNNIDSSTIVSHIPTHRVHIDHPKNKILGDPKSAVQTRGMEKKTSGAHALIEPKKLAQDLNDKNWVKIKQSEKGIFISQVKYVAKILKKFVFSSIKTTSTRIETQKPLLKDKEATDVDVHLYSSMIGSLMYLTASRPDIMFTVYACSRFQVTPKLLHLYAVKRIFRKSTIKGCQFLSRRLILWQCKKQTIVATSTEAEGRTPGSDKGSMTLMELTNLCTPLLQKILDLENLKTTQAKKIVNLKKRITKLKQRQCLRFLGFHLFRVGASKRNSLGKRKVSKHERKNLKSQQMFQDNVLDKDADTKMIVKDKDADNSARPIRSITTLQPLPTIDPQDKGNGILQEFEPIKKTKKKDQDQIERGTEVSLKIQAHLNEEARIKRETQEEASKAALAEMYDEVQAQIDDDHELAVRLTLEEQEKYTVKESSKLLAEFFERRKTQLAKERAEAIRSKPPTKTLKGT
nr:ribonuclease H-like domain, reverse transcriptase, RNA-dependent DNA polymerase [Tanacetum cinerariifolium]